MGSRQLRTSSLLRARAWTVAPVLAVAAVLAVLPCDDCPDHAAAHGAHARAATPVTHQMSGHAPAASDGRVPRAVASGAAADHKGMAFEVGTASSPIVTRGARGPLWEASEPTAPGSTKHGTYAEQTVARQLAQLREPAEAGDTTDEPMAERAAVLTTAEATKRLSKRCQRLIKRRKSTLGKTDRKRRSACLAQRRKLVAASKAPSTTPGVAAPSAPIQGPTPTAAPPTATEPAAPTPTTPAPTTPQVQTKQYAAAGVVATDGLDPFRLTRASATADVVNFELDNTDRQLHDLYIAPASSTGEVTGAPVKVIGRIEGGTRESADVELAPGRYKLLCTVDGHGPMAVDFTVYAPAAS